MFNVWLYIVNYEYMTLLEVRQNRWYALVQLGYSPIAPDCQQDRRPHPRTAWHLYGRVYRDGVSDLLSKISARDGLPVYHVPDGLCWISCCWRCFRLRLSLFIRDMYNARYMVGIIALCVIGFKFISHYFAILSDRTRMNDLGNMFDTTQTTYMAVVGVVIVICVVMCLFQGIGWRGSITGRCPGRSRCSSTNRTARWSSALASAAARAKRKEDPRSADVPAQAATARSGTCPAIMSSILVIASIAGDGADQRLVLAFGYASPEKETSINGVIPYVFQSHTMEPDDHVQRRRDVP